MLELAAYADRLSVRPGQTIHFHVSNSTGQPVQASLVRVICADANPKGPGVRTEPWAGAGPDKLLEPGAHPVPSGSHAVVPRLPEALAQGSFTLVCRVLPTLIGPRQTLFATVDAQGRPGFRLQIDEQGRLELLAGAGPGTRLAGADKPLRNRQWQFLWLSVDTDAGELTLGTIAMQRGKAAASADPTTEAARGMRLLTHARMTGGAVPALSGTFWMAASHDGTGDHFNGRIESPMLFAECLSPADLDALTTDEPRTTGRALAHWDFALDTPSSRIIDVGPHACHGTLVNTPGRGMPGARWDASQMSWREAPTQYGAIHFHDDDIDDCRWPAAFSWTVPDDARSAIYALTLTAAGAADSVPFHVVPPVGRPRARLAVLASTFTYTIYGNHVRTEWDLDPAWQARWREQAREWHASPHNPGDHREYGLSTYDMHHDDTGISIASWHRPMLNMRLGYITYPFEEIRGSGLRHFQADSHLVAWLEHKGIDYDIITDQELHDEGLALLAPYTAVLTGSHPEYHTRPMLDALEAYRDQGGRFCYLGGNGFYWKVALSPEKRGVIEIRRAEGGIRAWAAEPGEYYNQFDGEYGGLWRRNGRPPQHLTGVGFTAQGNFSGSYYRKRAAATDPRAAWIFAGVPGDKIGDHGFSAHGAAGFELDRADKSLGTPDHALVLASSENHPPEAPWILVPEEMLTHLLTIPHQPAKDLIHADIVFFETPQGGAVFSTGSITFCGSLMSNGFANDVSTMMENVVRRFLDPAPFAMPD